MTETHEQLSGGVAAADAGAETATVRIAPLPEGERTVGQSGKETVWDRDPLRAAVESGALDGTTIVKGEGGTNPHFPLDEQVPPENILGRVDSWAYEDDVGPVGEADVVDEQMAKRIDAGLLEVSADLERHLGEFDEERNAYTVDSVVSMPRVTVLERGASPNASIQTVEALGYNPSGESSLGDDGEQLADLRTIRFSAFGEMFGAEFLDEATGNLNALDGVTAVRSSEQTDPLLVAVVDSDAADLNTLNEDIVDALDDTPFEVFDDFDWIEATEREYLAGAQASDEGADTSTGPDADDDTDPDSTMGDDDISKEQLREQLAAAKAEKNQLETERDSLQEKTETLESEVEEKESELESKEETLEQKEETIENLESENEPLRKALAARAATGSSLSADVIAASNVSNEDLAESIVENEGLAEGDEDTDPIEMVSEQLAQAPAQRGQSPDETDDTPSNLTEEQLAAADDRAFEVLTSKDISEASRQGKSPREYVRDQMGVDPASVDSADELRSRVESNGGDA